ncbi:MAG TPA: ferritin-like domain-containing protein [Ktedonobacteraceae bacterium]|nr:ferritin-like domain-containing protein [Ktedonobacteraceae bacterium]
MLEEESNEIDEQIETLNNRTSRRSLLRGAIAGAAGATGLAVAGTAFLKSNSVFAASKVAALPNCTDTIRDILNIAATAEQLAVTFYTQGIAHSQTLGISGQDLNYLTAAIVEEQIHYNFLVKNGGAALTSVFSFPHGPSTFDSLDKFVATLDQLETAFESAYLAAIEEFAAMGQPGLAQIAGQICTIEAEHRALGRSLSTKIPTADNWAFTPVYVKSVGDAVNVLKQEGYLSPKGNNWFQYQPASLKNNDVNHRVPFSAMTCS